MAKAELTFTFATAFVIGVFLGSFSEIIYWLLMLLMLGAFLLRQFTDIPRVGWWLAIVGASAGIFYCMVFFHLQSANFKLPLESSMSVSGIVNDAPVARNGRLLFSFKALPPQQGSVTVFTATVYTISYGDKLKVKGVIHAADRADRDPLLVATNISIIGHGYGSRIKRWLFAIKDGFGARLAAVLPSQEAALAFGLTLGDQSGFSDELKTAMAKSGTTHLVALSGYNIAILATVIENLARGRIRRRAVFWFTLTFIILFVVMVGGQASIVRAALMGLLIIFATYRGRIAAIRIVIAVSAAAMLIENPFLIRWNVGFQLSFASLLGIIYVLPALLHYLKRDPASADPAASGLRSMVAENLLASTAAQLTVLPLLIQTFGTASLSGIFATVAIINAVPLSMLLGFLVGFAGWFSPLCAALIAWLLHPLLWYQLTVIDVFAKLSLPLKNPLGGWWTVGMYYVLLGWFVIRHFPQQRFVFKFHFESANEKT